MRAIKPIMNREWTEEELEILRRDRAAKVPVPVIAAKLGRPVPATYLRARRIGSLVQTHRPWDDETVSRLRALVLSDPPMTDKQIAAELGRSVTQIRWKMKDLALIGVRDLSKLAKATSTRTGSRAQDIRKATPIPSAPPKPQMQRRAPHPSPAPVCLYTPFELALKRLESQLATRLKETIRQAEAEMVQAAKAAIVEKARIDRRLAKLAKRSETAEAKVARVPKMTVPKTPVPKTPALRADGPPPARRKTEAATALPAVPVARRQAAAQPAAPAQPPALSPAPKILVVDTPAAPRPQAPESAPAQLSGRGGWKAVRRDPGRVAAQARAKAAKRSDAVDLAQAAQVAIERFIAERGVTRTTADATQALVSRLQARGYIVVRDDNGWTIDQRHRVATETDLIAFADARGISHEIAA